MSQDLLLRAALDCALRLGVEVLPLEEPVSGGGCTCRRGKACPHPGKHPRIPWAEKGLTTPKDIRAAWERWPNANVGIRTGSRS
ncbi:MAG TPA: bifunctional DNA primase/polymerase, partial [Ktedonobacterales bacterium]